MNNEKGNQSAFPIPVSYSAELQEKRGQMEGAGWDINKGMAYGRAGLTKREYFAAMALQGLVAAFDQNNVLSKENLVKKSLEYSDELLKQLSQ